MPIVLYFECIALLLCYCFALDWILNHLNTLELIDYVLCTICLLHGLFNFNKYIVFAKSSFITMITLSLYHLVYYKFNLDNLDYYFFYITILASNSIYIVFREIIKP